MDPTLPFSAAFRRGDRFLLEGALGERLKRDYALTPHPEVALAIHGTTPAGQAALRALWTEYAAIAHAHGLPFLATTPTRRADRTRVERAGLTAALLEENVRFLRTVLTDCPGPAYLGGMVGCSGEAYTGAGCLPEEEAYALHRWQVTVLAEAGADFLYGALLPTLPEALGLARAMAETGLPYILSFTLHRNGCLPDGTPLSQAMAQIDRQVQPQPLCYMTNCVHPAIVYDALTRPCNDIPLVRTRFLGLQGNTSPLDYAALDQATDLLTAPPEVFAAETVRLGTLAPFQIFGGCCGTDGRHLRAIARRWTAATP